MHLLQSVQQAVGVTRGVWSWPLQKQVKHQVREPFAKSFSALPTHLQLEGSSFWDADPQDDVELDSGIHQAASVFNFKLIKFMNRSGCTNILIGKKILNKS